MKDDLKFPSNFLWGTATAAHQVEGNNKYSEWWRWEQAHKKIENSGIACDHYNRFKSDFKLAKKILHNNAHRLSISWSRVEPEEGMFDRREIEHYREVFKELKRLNMKIILTLHHFVNPAWFADKGGWEKKKNIKYFVRFAELCMREYKNLVDYWCIFNEPNVYVSMSYLSGYWPPQKRNFLLAGKVYFNMSRAHNMVYGAIKRISGNSMVGSVINMTYFKAFGIFNKLLVPLFKFIANHSFIALTHNRYDFIGINYYALHVVSWKDFSIKRPFPSDLHKVVTGEMTDLGWPIYPQGIYEIVKEVHDKYKVPILITENGVADATDKKRPSYVVNHLTWLHQAIKEGVGIRGYFHWTLMDNFEWSIGRKAKFGLFKTDYKILKRIPRKSARVYGKICKANALQANLLE